MSLRQVARCWEAARLLAFSSYNGIVKGKTTTILLRRLLGERAAELLRVHQLLNVEEALLKKGGFLEPSGLVATVIRNNRSLGGAKEVVDCRN